MESHEDSGTALIVEIGDDISALRRRLSFRSWHRGTRESDLLLGTFADRYLETFDVEDLAAYEALLTQSDPDIYNWYSKRETVPDDLASPVMDLLLAHKIPPQSV